MVAATGRFLIHSYNTSLGFWFLLYQTINKIFTRPFRVKEIIKQLHFVLNESAPIVAFCVCSAAAVTIVESSFHMKIVVKNDSLVPGFAALLILRELGVVVALLLVTSRVGAGIAAEVGTMKVTEQIDAFKMLGMDPVKYIVVPRFIACILGGAVLSLIANLICLYVAMLVSQIKLGYSAGLFLTSIRGFVEMQDLCFSCIKGAVFGGVIPLVSCYFGLRCQAGPEGVGRATTNSVVVSSVAIIGLDFLLSWVFTNFY